MATNTTNADNRFNVNLDEWDDELDLVEINGIIEKCVQDEKKGDGKEEGRAIASCKSALKPDGNPNSS